MKEEVWNLSEAEFQRVAEKLNQLANDNLLTCGQAHQLANSLQIEPILVGKTAQRLGIKISDCQLGCFGRYKER